MKRIQLLLLALLACGAVAAGCGDDDDEAADTTDEPAVTETAPVDTTPEEADSEEPETDAPPESSDRPDPDDPTVQRAIESCKQSVQGAAQLSDDVKSDLEDICEQAAEGDEEAVREASIAVCKKIVEDSVPAGSARDQALSSCEQAG